MILKYCIATMAAYDALSPSDQQDMWDCVIQSPDTVRKNNDNTKMILKCSQGMENPHGWATMGVTEYTHAEILEGLTDPEWIPVD